MKEMGKLQMKKRILSILLIVCMMMELMPISAVAVETTSSSTKSHGGTYTTATPSEAKEESTTAQAEEESTTAQAEEASTTAQAEEESTTAQAEEESTTAQAEKESTTAVSTKYETATSSQAHGMLRMDSGSPSIELVPGPELTFNDAIEGYKAQTPYNVSIQNTGDAPTGNLTLELSGSDSNSFSLSKVTISNIEANTAVNFTVAPKTGLAAGTYEAAITVSGSNVTSESFDVRFTVTPLQSNPDYKIGETGYQWTGSDQSIILSGNDDTLTILKSPTANLKIDVQSEHLSTVTIEGNSISCDNTYIEVHHNITLNLKDLDITAPDRPGMDSSGIILHKGDAETGQMKLLVSGDCTIKGFSYGNAIHSIYGQNLLIAGDGTLTASGGNSTDNNSSGGNGIYMETFTLTQGTKLTIDGGVTVNANGGSTQSHNGGGGILLAWGDLFIGDATVNAYGGENVSPDSGKGGSAIQAYFLGADHSKGGNITIESGSVTAVGGDSVKKTPGSGLYAFNELNINGGIVTAAGGNSQNGNGSYGVFVFENDLNISGGTITAAGGNGGTNGSSGLFSYYGDTKLSGGTIIATGGNSDLNGSYGVFAYYGSIYIENDTEITATGGNGKTGVGGIGLRAYGMSGGTKLHPGTVKISDDAGNVYIQGGQGATGVNKSITGKNIYVSTGNIGSISMEGNVSRSIKNVDGDDVYLMKVLANPAEEIDLSSDVIGTHGIYTYRAVTKADGLAYIWLPKGTHTLSAPGYLDKTAVVSENDNSVPEETIQKEISAKLPGAPTDVTAVSGDKKAVVSFTPPKDNGGSPILNYTVTVNPGGETFTGTSSPIMVTGLTNGTSYTFTITARNAIGTGTSSSPSNSVSPAPAETYSVSGMVLEGENKKPAAETKMVLKHGILQVGSAITDVNGHFTITGIPNGSYNLIISKGNKVLTLLVHVDHEDYVFSEGIHLPAANTNSVVEIQDEAPNIVVGNLENQFTENDRVYAQTTGNQVEIKLVARLKTRDEIKAEAEKITHAANGKNIGFYLDLSVYKTQTGSNTQGAPERLETLPGILKIVLPLPENLQGKTGLTVYRVHNGIVQTLQSGSADENGEHFVIGSDAITIYTRNFSTYAIGYTDTSQTGGSSRNSSHSETDSSIYDQPVGLPTMGQEEISPAAIENGKSSGIILENTILNAITKAWAEAKAKGRTANGIGVSLKVKEEAGSQTLELVLPAHIMKLLTDQYVKRFEISSSRISLSLDLDALKEIRSQSTGDVTLNVTPEQNLSVQARNLMHNRPVYHVTTSFIKNGKTVEISSLGNGRVTILIPYKPSRDEETGYLYGVSLDEEGHAVRIPDSAYDTNKKGILFSTNHFVTSGVGYIAPSSRFTDVSSHWAKEAIDYVTSRGLLTGTSETVFSPDSPFTWGELITALGNLANVDTKLNTEWAYKKGLLKDTKQFSPDQVVTRGEMAVILNNYTKIIDGGTLPVTREVKIYADKNSIDRTYQTAVRSMQQAGIMMGEINNQFNPNNNVTRAQASIILFRYRKLTIDPATTQGWVRNDSGQFLYYRDGKAITGWLNTGTTENSNWYYFYADGTLAFNTSIDEYEVDENGLLKE
ncbi:S-layer homology domain-containing protein [Clostridium sp. E02]|uniref:S-layer homology domain-containing protein n=1 Tax=Clostridium sp. E02 TaxID=2487134 RepID=UPI000F536FC1|nr:S-layer homology domain-containing protein [Clostridium sp. E02]